MTKVADFLICQLMPIKLIDTMMQKGKTYKSNEVDERAYDHHVMQARFRCTSSIASASENSIHLAL